MPMRAKKMYDYADKVLALLLKQFIELFDSLKVSFFVDELNVIENVNSLYEELDELSQMWLTNIAAKAYKDAGGEDNSFITRQWLTENVLEEYDKVTKYVYTNEVDRKRSRLIEALIASEDKSSETDKALKLWSAMISQYAITAVDTASLAAYKSLGVREVVWKSIKDGKQCKVCTERDGKVYPIDEVPPKPHIGCRCYLVPKGRKNNGK